MARGWESKAVEAQIEAAAEPSGNGKGSHSAEEAKALRKKQDLVLSRNRVLQQLEASTNQRYTDMLKAALADLEAKLKELP